MIVADQKPIDEIQGYLAGHANVLVLGCGTCVTVCLAGGEREVATLASMLRLVTPSHIEESTIERQCDAEFFDMVKDRVATSDAVLSLACGVGVQMAARLYPDKPVYPALNTRFMGTNDGAGQWSENCLACGGLQAGNHGRRLPRDPVFRVLRLEKKVNAGLDFVQTQCIYDIDRFERWMEQVRERNLHERCKILAGVTPLKTAGMARYMRDKVAGITVPGMYVTRMERAKDQNAEGIAICVEQIGRLRSIKGVAGIHLMAIEWEEKVAEIVEKAGLKRS